MEKGLENIEKGDEKTNSSFIDDIKIESVFHVEGNKDHLDLSEVEDNEVSKEVSCASRRPRTNLHLWQVVFLKKEYEKYSIPTQAVKRKLCNITGLDWRVVATWFQNRRAKEKRLIKKLDNEHGEDGNDFIDFEIEDTYHDEFKDDKTCENNVTTKYNFRINNSPEKDYSEGHKTIMEHQNGKIQDETIVGHKRSHSHEPNSCDKVSPRKKGRPRKFSKESVKHKKEPTLSDEDLEIEIEESMDASSNSEDIIHSIDRIEQEFPQFWNHVVKKTTELGHISRLECKNCSYGITKKGGYLNSMLKHLTGYHEIRLNGISEEQNLNKEKWLESFNLKKVVGEHEKDAPSQERTDDLLLIVKSGLDSLENDEMKSNDDEELQDIAANFEKVEDPEMPNETLEKMIQSKSQELFGSYNELATQTERRAWWSQPAVTQVLGLVKSKQLSMTDAQKLMGITMTDATHFLGSCNAPPTNSPNNNNCSNMYNRNVSSSNELEYTRRSRDTPARLNNFVAECDQGLHQALVIDTLERLRDNSMSLKEAKKLLGVNDKFIAKQFKNIFGERLHIDMFQETPSPDTLVLQETSPDNLVCHDCGLAWEPVYLNHPVNLLLEDLANFEDKVLHAEKISSPKMCLNMFKAKHGYTDPSQPATLTCIVPQQDKKIHWQVKHVSLGQPGANGCQMVPLTREVRGANLNQSHHSRSGATLVPKKSQQNLNDSSITSTKVIKKELHSEEEGVSEYKKKPEEGEDREKGDGNIRNKPSEELVIKEEPLDRIQLEEDEYIQEGSEENEEEELMNLTSASSGIIINSEVTANNTLDDSSSVLYSILAHEASMTDKRDSPGKPDIYATNVPLQDWKNSITSIINYKNKSLPRRQNFNDPENKQCYMCDESFPNVRILNKHLKAKHMRTHDGARPFECNLCGKAFNHRANLISHLKSHSGVKEYSCPICHKAFTHPSDRLSHVLFKVCLRAARHLRKTHDGWECRTCGENKFKGAGPAERHVRIHEIGCTKKCPFCHKEFDNQQRAYAFVKHIKYDHKEYLKNHKFSCNNKEFFELFFTQNDLKGIENDNGFINLTEFEKMLKVNAE